MATNRLLILAVLTIAAVPAAAQQNVPVFQADVSQSAVPSSAELRSALQQQLQSRYVLAKTTPDGGDLVAAGAVLTLQKDGLTLGKVYMSGTHRSPPIENTYENGGIRQTGLTGFVSNLNVFLSALGGVEAQAKSFGQGEKLWITRISAERDAIVFRLMSDPINNMRYHGTLRFPYGNLASVETALAFVAEALTTDSPIQAIAVAPAASALAPPPTPAAAPAGSEGNPLDPSGMFRLAVTLADQGNNVEAVRWLRKSSDSGHVKATNLLGYMYEEGRGVPQNFAEANKLYLRAMKRGDPDAMFNRGMLMANGRGMKSDATQAYMHFVLAVAYAKDEETREAVVRVRDEFAAKLSQQQLAQAQAMADKFAKSEIK